MSALAVRFRREIKCPPSLLFIMVPAKGFAGGSVFSSPPPRFDFIVRTSFFNVGARAVGGLRWRRGNKKSTATSNGGGA